MKELIGLHSTPDAVHEGEGAAKFFATWHRWYVFAIENVLRTVDSSITMPYWRWTTNNENWWVGKPFLADKTWLGTNGDWSCGKFADDGVKCEEYECTDGTQKEDCGKVNQYKGDGCVRNGAFAYPEWKPPFGPSRMDSECLTREFIYQPNKDFEEVCKLLENDFNSWGKFSDGLNN